MARHRKASGRRTEETWRERVRKRLAHHSRRYWVGAVAVLILTSVVSPYVDNYDGFVQLRYLVFQYMSQLEWRPLIPRFVKVVLVKDDAHWGDRLQGAVPIKRDYLGDMVEKLANDHVNVIALDFDVRLTSPTAKGTPGDFGEITADTLEGVKYLIRKIIKAADDGHQIVLSRTVWWGDKNGYKLLADIYQPFGICSVLKPDGRWENPGAPGFSIDAVAARNIRCGYIALSKDLRLLPPRVVLDDGKWIDSFSFALADDINPEVAEKAAANAYYGSYIPRRMLDDYKVVLSARDVLPHDVLPGKDDKPSKKEKDNDDDIRQKLNGANVIVGGSWHKMASGSGDIADLHNTPIGPVEGTVIHENFAEAILDSRTFGYVPEWVLQVAEFLFGAAAMIALAIYSSLGAKVTVFGLLAVLLMLVQWVMMQIFGTFFEAFVPLLGLVIHSVIEKFVEQE